MTDYELKRSISARWIERGHARSSAQAWFRSAALLNIHSRKFLAVPGTSPFFTRFSQRNYDRRNRYEEDFMRSRRVSDDRGCGPSVASAQGVSVRVGGDRDYYYRDRGYYRSPRAEFYVHDRGLHRGCTAAMATER